MASPKKARCTANAAMCPRLMPPPPSATPRSRPTHAPTATIATSAAIAPALAITRRARVIGCASTSARIRSSSSPAVMAAAAVMATAPITSGPYTAPISLRNQPVRVA